jgi:hypothetical protein
LSSGYSDVIRRFSSIFRLPTTTGAINEVPNAEAVFEMKNDYLDLGVGGG